MVNLKITKTKNNKYYFLCESVGSRSGFTHKITMFLHRKLGSREHTITLASSKQNYINRTWEKYEFQSTLKQVVKGALLTEVLNQEEFNDLLLQIEKGF